jgi:hypothetical protein
MTRPPDLFDWAATPPPPRPPTVGELTDLGIARSADHADRVRPGWGDEALAMFRLYASAHEKFRTADVRDWAYSTGLAEPPHGTAWGGVARRAASQGIVRALERSRSPDPLCHGAFMTVWRSLVFQDTRQ